MEKTRIQIDFVPDMSRPWRAMGLESLKRALALIIDARYQIEGVDYRVIQRT